MRAATLNINPNAGRELTDMLILPELKDVELRDWKAYDESVEAGYEAAKLALDGGKLFPNVYGRRHNDETVVAETLAS